MQYLFRHAVTVAAVLLAACGGGSDTPESAARKADGATAVAGASVAAPGGPQKLALPGGPKKGVVDARLAKLKGPTDVWVTLEAPSVAAYKSERLQAMGAERQMRALGTTAREAPAASTQELRQAARGHRDTLRARQEGLMNQLRSVGAKELGRVTVAHNAVAVRVDASKLKDIAALQGVAAVRPVLHYEKALSETVPYVGASAAQAAGKDGTGVRVAVLDSGIDYTHYNLGGAGTEAAYVAAYGTDTSDPRNTTRDGLFPTAKVVDGYDFVGEQWPNCAPGVDCRTEDDDPIDGGPASGHGTHVADIIAGRSADGLHKGVAPGASLVAVKVCSSVATSCNGVALLKAMDFALDPDGDGDTSDAVDVINMSLGSSYGQIEDDLSAAAANAVKLGVVVVASAGNSANRPYITGSPAATPGVISVAQTTVPSEQAYPLIVNSPPAIAGSYANTATVEWAPITTGFTGDVVHVGRGCPGDAYLDNPAGKVALIDRGACAVSLKVDRAAQAGATAVLIGLVAPGDAVSFSYGGGTQFVQTLIIQQSLSNAIKANKAAPVNVTVPATGIALVGGMATTSSRGPSVSFSAIKPEIGAPGASISAEAGTGNGETAFGGTSGAAPMVSGAAAILLQAHPSGTPDQIKALLMNSANTQVFTHQALLPGELAPITRIGAGELRVDRALALSSLARDVKGQSAALSFGYQSVSTAKFLTKKLLVENLSGSAKHFSVTPSFRYANDQASGAVRIIAPHSVVVGPHGKKEIDVVMIIDGRKLPDWTLDGGPNGGNGALLNLPEYDGYLTLKAGSETLSVPWHVLPRKSAQMVALDTSLHAGAKIRLANAGVAPGDFEVFSLVGVSGKADSSELPEPGDNFAFVDLRALGVRLVEPGYLQFAVNTFGRRAHPNYPAEFDVEIDTNRDGTPEFIIFNAELGGFAASGSNVVNIFNVATGAITTVFYTDADLQSANAILTVPTELLGMTDDTTFNFTVTVFDNYFTGNGTDSFPTVTYTPTKPKYVADLATGTVAPFSTAKVGTAAVPGGDTASPSQTGLLLMYRLDAGREAEVIRLR